MTSEIVDVVIRRLGEELGNIENRPEIVIALELNLTAVDDARQGRGQAESRIRNPVELVVIGEERDLAAEDFARK